ncbi:hypothetical protein [uncultured Enterovirga sp.]|uniref:hypothetical protein n=1 Tax=uncultured Enterovirga sp. TaxID=2026352 RepID=UPI0035C9D9C4
MIRIGITGHRLNKLPEATRRAVRLALSRTFSLLDRALAQSGPGQTRRDIEIVSALAEGVDRMAVEAAPPSWRLAALLPTPRRDYERDFLAEGETASASLDDFRTLLGRATSVTELPIVGSDDVNEDVARSQQYSALASRLVRQIDLLVAVWDGGPAEGPGGTAHVIEEGTRCGMRVIWIDPRRPEDAQVLSGFVAGDLAQPIVSRLEASAFATLIEAGLGSRPA